jgi:cytochrome c-type biogenesis protein
MHGKNGRIPILIIAFFFVLLIAQPVAGVVILEYFNQPGCIYCEKTNPIIDAIKTRYQGRVLVESVEIDNRAGVRLLMSYGVTEIPVVVINRNKVLIYNEINPERLDTEIRLAESGAYPIPEKRKTFFDGDNALSVFFAFILGVMTGFSPCLLGSLVVLIAAANGPYSNGINTKYHPLIFGAGIITAYLFVTALILGVGVAIVPDTGFQSVIRSIAGLLAIFVGLLQVGLFSLPDWMDLKVSTLVSRFKSSPGIFLLGIIFAVLFAPCALAPFLVLIETIVLSNSIAPLTMILAFSVGILAPFVALTALRNSFLDERLMRYAGFVQKIGGVFVIGFGIWLIFFA